MFESAEMKQSVSKTEFEREMPDLRSRLLAAQRELRKTKHPVIIVIAGVEGAGKSEVVNRLHEWLDARGMSVAAFWRDSDEEKERPRYWRFWRTLPPRGTVGVLLGSWYSEPIVDRVYKHSSPAEFDRELQRIVFFERMLAEDGALIMKLWLHISKEEQTARLTDRSRKSKIYAPNVREFAKRYARFAAASDRAIRVTDTAEAPWRIIESTDARHRDLTVAKLLLEALEDLVRRRAEPARDASPIVLAQADEEPVLSGGPTVLDRLDLVKKSDEARYDRQLARVQSEIAAATWDAWNKKRSIVAVFEGSDAAGKGGAIRRLIAPIDARLYRVISVAAPTDEERAQHYLWRFWRQIPRDGAITIYDRSWYGRVLVERVERFAGVGDWSRAYREINEFEEQLVDHGVIVVKFWLQIDEEEQLRRFREREKVAWKQHKITDEDWRNREKWSAYRNAVHDMVTRTSSAIAPWHLIPANDKKLARLQVLKTFARTLERAL